MRCLVPIAASSLLALGLLAPGVPAAPAGQADAAPAPDAFHFALGEIASYSGTFSLKQGSGDSTEETQFRTRLTYRVDAANGGKSTLLVIRLVKATEAPATEANEKGSGTEGGKGEKKEASGAGGDAKSGAGAEFGGELAFARTQRFAMPRSGDRYTLEALDDEELELNETQGGLDLYCPLEALLPPTTVPPEGEKRQSRGEVSVLGLAQATASIVTSARREPQAAGAPGTVTVQREIAPAEAGAKLAFEFQGNPATLLRWRELFAFTPGGGLVAAVERDLTFELTLEDSPLRVEASLRLKRETLATPSAAEGKALDEVVARLRSAASEFAAHKPSAEIEKSVQAAAAAARGTLLDAAAPALELRLAVYRSFFEESEEGRQLAQLLGKPAPDFTLADMEGKEVKFREVTRGKVTLLTFWGYG